MNIIVSKNVSFKAKKIYPQNGCLMCLKKMFVRQIFKFRKKYPWNDRILFFKIEMG